VDSENFDEFMKELGVGMVMRMAAKGVKPRLVISENNGKWAIRSESTFRTVSYDFTPGVEFNETTPDGREVTVCRFSLYKFY
jgi:fatty acid-binding protein 3